MRPFDPAALAAVQSGHSVAAMALWCDLRSGPFGFWTGVTDVILDGVTYRGVGGLGQISNVESNRDASISGVSLQLSGIDPVSAQLIATEDYFQRSARLFVWIMDPSWTVRLGVIEMFRGRIDVLGRQTADGEAVLNVSLEGAMRAAGRPLGRTRSDPDQRRIDPTDRFFESVHTAPNTVIYWGGDPPRRRGSA